MLQLHANKLNINNEKKNCALCKAEKFNLTKYKSNYKLYVNICVCVCDRERGEKNGDSG